MSRTCTYSPEYLQKLFDQYFKECEEKGKPLSITGLGLFIGFTRAGLNKLQLKEEYSDIISLAKARVENFYEEKLTTSKNSIAGPIFALKMCGWKDTQDITINSGTDTDIFKQIEQLKQDSTKQE